MTSGDVSVATGGVVAQTITVYGSSSVMVTGGMTSGSLGVSAGGMTVLTNGLISNGLKINSGDVFVTGGLTISGGSNVLSNVNASNVFITGGMSVYGGLSGLSNITIRLDMRYIPCFHVSYSHQMSLFLRGGMMVVGDGTIANGNGHLAPINLNIISDDITVTNGLYISSDAIFRQRLSVSGGITIPQSDLSVTDGLSVYDQGLVIGSTSSTSITTLAVTSRK